MLDISISQLTINRAPAVAGQPQVPAKKTAAPETDVIDLSKPLTPEEVERMRGAGFLGYGAISATKTVTTKALESGGAAAQVTMDYRHEHFDVVNGAAYQYAFSGLGVFTSGGSAFMEANAQMRCTWEDGSYWESALHECAFSLEMGGHSSWYIPPRLNEDGSWSLAEYGPSARFTVSGYHSSFSFTQSDGEQTHTFWSETFVEQVRGTIPGGPPPDGAEKLPSPRGRDLLDRLDRLADQLRCGFDARA